MVFKSVWKGIKSVGKAFKWVGKQIMKGFGKLGKFMNKFGILGQVGMMFITGGISSAMFAGLRTLGQGFMTGLSTAGKFGQLAHKVITGVQKIAAIPGNAVGTAAKEAFGSITDAVVGSVKDTYSYISNKIPGLASPDKIQSLKGTGGFIDEVTTTLSDATKRAIDLPSTVADATAQSITDAGKFLNQKELYTNIGYTPETAPDIRTFDVKTGTKIKRDITDKSLAHPRGKPMLDPETGEVMREDVFSTVQKDIKYSGENLEAFRLDAERAGAPSIGFPLEQDSLLYPTSKDYKAITSALDPQMVTSEGTQTTFGELTSRLPTEGLLRRSGSAMADEAKNYFTLQKFGSEGMQGVSQSLISPTRPEGQQLSMPTAQQVRAQTDVISDTVAAMTNQQWRASRPNYQLSWDNNQLDNFYDGLDTNQATYNIGMGYGLSRPKGTVAFPTA